MLDEQHLCRRLQPDFSRHYDRRTGTLPVEEHGRDQVGVGSRTERKLGFHGRRVTKVGRKSNTAAAGGLGAAEQGVREAHSGTAGTFLVAENATTGSVSLSGKGSSSHGSRVVSPGESVPECTRTPLARARDGAGSAR